MEVFREEADFHGRGEVLKLLNRLLRVGELSLCVTILTWHKKLTY